MKRKVEEQIIELEERIKKLEDIVLALKSNVKEQKQTAEIRRKKMWLNGYPDETEEKEV